LDSTELRPGGGSIGNYGIATISGGRLTAAHITDTHLIDNAFTARGHSIAYPSAYSWDNLSHKSWSLHDSNLDADFPTAAHYAEHFVATVRQAPSSVFPRLLQLMNNSLPCKDVHY